MTHILADVTSHDLISIKLRRYFTRSTMGFRLLHGGLALSFRSIRCRHSSTASANLREVLSKELEVIRDAGTWKVERVITSPQAASIKVQERNGAILNFCANNYLGLSVSTYIHTTCALL